LVAALRALRGPHGVANDEVRRLFPLLQEWVRQPDGPMRRARVRAGLVALLMAVVESLTMPAARRRDRGINRVLALIGPAILAGSWNITAISEHFARHPAYMPAQLAGFLVALLALQGKLERLPFDIPHAKTEIVGGQFTEYTGRLLAFFNMAVSMEMVVGAALLNAVFLGGGLGLTGTGAFALFMLKTLGVVLLLVVLRVLMARIRIEQMINFCWQILAPLAMAQIVFDIFLRIKLG
ncbi:MAG TPA: NADH-quinone oxidoreductase subunit H, partial [Elusimicrobiales bacterium]|nr:NADH-quinone oxidoreductase subunit H [Elusimicrobiales bacterium]